METIAALLRESEELARESELIFRKTRRLVRWTLVMAAVAVACAVVAIASTPAPIVCLFDCAENEGGCTNDSFCLGPCVCDLDLEECVPE